MSVEVAVTTARTIILFIIVLALGACGTTAEDRGLSGAGLGAAAGSLIGAVSGFGLWQGALLGAGVGAATGILTDEKQVDLGRPVWKKGSAAKPQTQPRAAPKKAAAPTSSHGSVIKDVQQGLVRAGYDPGGTDGRMGAKTRAAIIRYQQEHGLPVDGTPSNQLLQHLNSRQA